ncbi:MAG: phenylalanine--tRNA ligase subunit beta [Deltaproteobacteria bacterium]|nr:phenylalanine--tRNA ligase subunit beta [Deltaproteobacteria bacterium]MBW1986033.1 phenylalanine--tRNA ligase subunit beta [Deltaproteobacteria bacterium]MBW2133962.1 phenylalanine--tRNA ligase subunit beta [Deltaproteobacteria bacterium]
MRLSINWLKDYLDLTISPAELADRLTLVGLEVEVIETLQPAFSGVVVGRVKTVEPHPRADRLQVAGVDDGCHVYQVVCGAPNLQSGRLYPFAPVGAVIAGGQNIKAAKLRGVVSEGMLLAEDELGLSEDHLGLMEIPQDLEVGADLGEALALRDVVLEVAITPNRPDCLSILGLAREISALLDQPLQLPHISVPEGLDNIEDWAGVSIEAPDHCPRYAARLIRNLVVKPSPFWMRQRLQACGLRAINNLVDVTNYVLLEYGQPLHAFDFDRLEGGRIVVRLPQPQEKSFTTLDGQARYLHPETLLICDARAPVAVAGVMGGLASEVTPATCQVLIESAYFNPRSIRRTSKRLGLSTEASYRFERGVDPEGVINALERATQLMAALGEGQVCQGRIDVYPQPVIRPQLQLRAARTNAILGTDLSLQRLAELLRRLNMPPQRLDADTLEVQVPPYRGDLTREVDLIEEVARLHGFEHIPVSLPQVAMAAHRPPKAAVMRSAAKAILLGMGFFEVITYAFQAERLSSFLVAGSSDPSQFVQLANPLSEEQAVMRLDLIPGLLETMRKNAAHSIYDLKIFELSKVFIPRSLEQLPEEKPMLAGLMSGVRQPPGWNVPEEELDFFDLKGAVETLLSGLLVPEVSFQPVPGLPFLQEGARVFSADLELGFLGELHPEVGRQFDLKAPAWIFNLQFDRLTEVAREFATFTPLPRYPAVYRDLALVVDNSIATAQVLSAIYRYGQPWVVEANLFDVYSGPPIPEGERSLAFHLCYLDPERTLTDIEVNQQHEALIQNLQQELKARLRV